MSVPFGQRAENKLTQLYLGQILKLESADCMSGLLANLGNAEPGCDLVLSRYSRRARRWFCGQDVESECIFGANLLSLLPESVVVAGSVGCLGTRCPVRSILFAAQLQLFHMVS